MLSSENLPASVGTGLGDRIESICNEERRGSVSVWKPVCRFGVVVEVES